jgi:hypothetical protein
MTEQRVAVQYPREPGAVTHVVLDLVDVRAADPIRLSYDFERDGWVVEQAAVFAWDGDDAVCDPQWAEVAFVKAWQREAA